MPKIIKKQKVVTYNYYELEVSESDHQKFLDGEPVFMESVFSNSIVFNFTETKPGETAVTYFSELQPESNWPPQPD